MKGNYRSPHALKQAFERKYRDSSRQLVLVMQRFVARVCATIEGAIVKGGLGLELRFESPRTTLDADLIISGSGDLDTRLKEAGELSLDDFLWFRVKKERSSEIIADGLAYPGTRYAVQAFFSDGRPPAGQRPFRKFRVEAVVRSPVPFDEFTCSWPEFLQIPAVSVRVLSLPWQLAEKVHAFTDPRHRNPQNKKLWRSRDVLDIYRCATGCAHSLGVDEFSSALRETFQMRKEKAPDLPSLPARLPLFPDFWEDQLREEIEQAPALSGCDLDEPMRVARLFVDPVLGEQAVGNWNARALRWCATTELEPPSSK